MEVLIYLLYNSIILSYVPTCIYNFYHTFMARPILKISLPSCGVCACMCSKGEKINFGFVCIYMKIVRSGDLGI